MSSDKVHSGKDGRRFDVCTCCHVATRLLDGSNWCDQCLTEHGYIKSEFSGQNGGTPEDGAS